MQRKVKTVAWSIITLLTAFAVYLLVVKVCAWLTNSDIHLDTHLWLGIGFSFFVLTAGFLALHEYQNLSTMPHWVHSLNVIIDDAFGTGLAAAFLVFASVAVIQGFLYIGQTLTPAGFVAIFILGVISGAVYWFDSRAKFAIGGALMAFVMISFILGAIRSIATVTPDAAGVWVLVSSIAALLGCIFPNPNAYEGNGIGD